MGMEDCTNSKRLQNRGRQTMSHASNLTATCFGKCNFTGMQPGSVLVFLFFFLNVLSMAASMLQGVDKLQQISHGPQSLKYFLPGPLREKFANLCSRMRT